VIWSALQFGWVEREVRAVDRHVDLLKLQRETFDDVRQGELAGSLMPDDTLAKPVGLMIGR
jgi:hypothetical protein